MRLGPVATNDGPIPNTGGVSDLPPTTTPPAGWYPDPSEPSVVRWWDGTQWTHHVQPAPQPEPVSSAPSWLNNRTAIAAVIGLVAILTGLFLVLGGDDESAAPNLSRAESEQADGAAQIGARTAQAAIETFATDNGSSYDASAEDLLEIEPTLPATLEVDAAADSYTVTVPSESGTRFSLSRSPEGTTTFTCDSPGEGACPERGDWGGQ